MNKVTLSFPLGMYSGDITNLFFLDQILN